MPPDLGELIREATEQLTDRASGTHDASPRRDAELLAAHLLDQNREWVIAHDDLEVTGDFQGRYLALIQRRVAAEPMAYLLGYREFWSRRFKVTPATLIPRPETELLIETLIERFDHSPRRVADLGTGSGIIAVSLAAERPDWQITAVDINDAALSIARENATGCSNVEFIQGSWCEPLEGSFDIIVSNPPYVREGDPHLVELAFEPRSALTAGDDGLDAYRELIPQCVQRLAPGGTILLEHGYDQANDIARLLTGAGLTDVENLHDLAQHTRATLAKR